MTQAIKPWQLGPEIRDLLKKRISRRSAFKVGQSSRSASVLIWKFIQSLAPNVPCGAKFIPVSTVEGRSEFRVVEGEFVSIVDYEQVNAISFLCSNRIKLERPIFHFIEYMIRAAEYLASLGYIDEAEAVSHKSIDELLRYARTFGEDLSFQRPIVREMLPHAVRAIECVVEPFVVGHEMAHGVYRNHSSIRDLFYESYDEVIDKSANPIKVFGTFMVNPLFGSSNEYTVSNRGLEGFAVRNIPMMTAFQQQKDDIIEEAFCDFFGLIACCYMAQSKNVPYSFVFSNLFHVYDAVEQLSILYELIDQASAAKRGCTVIRFKQSRASARWRLLINTIPKIIDRVEILPENIKNYLRDLPLSYDEALKGASMLGYSNAIAERAFLTEIGESESTIKARILSCKPNKEEIQMAERRKKAQVLLALNGSILKPWQTLEKHVADNSFLFPELLTESDTQPIDFSSVAFFNAVKCLCEFFFEEDFSAKADGSDKFRSVESNTFEKIRKAREYARLGIPISFRKRFS